MSIKFASTSLNSAEYLEATYGPGHHPDYKYKKRKSILREIFDF